MEVQVKGKSGVPIVQVMFDPFMEGKIHSVRMHKLGFFCGEQYRNAIEKRPLVVYSGKVQAEGAPMLTDKALLEH